ncbi:MAG: hydantoinase/oxoprolinase family protein, partial [Gammaproteobacteria bacterium]
LVMADIRHDFVRTKITRGDDVTAEVLAPLYAQLEDEAKAALLRDGVIEEHRHLERGADLRYVGQAYEVSVPVPDGELSAESIEAIVERFHELHMQLYAHNQPEKPLEFVSGRVAAIGKLSAPSIRLQDKNHRRAEPKEQRDVYFDETSDYVNTAVYDRRELTPGSELRGPAIVEQVDTTVLIHPGQQAGVDERSNLLISTGG